MGNCAPPDAEFDVEACVMGCEQEASVEERTCVVNAECLGLEQCFEGGGHGPTCQDACNHIGECAPLGEGFDIEACVMGCERESSAEERACIVSAECEGLEQCRNGGGEGPSCAEACDHVEACAPPDSGFDPEACVAGCERESSVEQRICVVNSECEALDACGDDAGAPACPEVCDHLSACAPPDVGFDAEACVAGCERESSAEERTCIVSSECQGIDACIDGGGRGEGPSCQEACMHLGECAPPGMGHDPEQCLADCELAASVQERACIVASDCADVPACFGGGDVGQPTCDQACDRMQACQIPDFDPNGCRRACQMESTPEEVMCVVESECEQLDACFGERPGGPPTCETACQRLAGCNLQGFSMPQCMQGCIAADNLNEIECVMQSACEQAMACFEG